MTEEDEYIPAPEARPTRLRLNVDAAQRFIFAGLASDYLVGDLIKSHIRSKRGHVEKLKHSAKLRGKLKKAMWSVRALVSLQNDSQKRRQQALSTAVHQLRDARFHVFTELRAPVEWGVARHSKNAERQKEARHERFRWARRQEALGVTGRDVFRDTRAIVCVQSTAGDVEPRCMHDAVFASYGLLIIGGRSDGPAVADFATDSQLYVANLDTDANTLRRLKVADHRAAPIARHRHSSARLMTADGQEVVCVYGGKRCDGTILDDMCALVQHGDQIEWSLISYSTTLSPGARYGHTLVSCSRYSSVLLFAGCSGQDVYNDIWRLNVWGDTIIVFGGASSCDENPQAMAMGDLWSFDIGTRRWHELTCSSPRPAPRCGHSAFVINDILCIYGGQHADWAFASMECDTTPRMRRAVKVLSDMWTFSLTTATWQQVCIHAPPYPPCRSFHACVPLNFGGTLMAAILFGRDPHRQEVTSDGVRSTTGIFCICFAPSSEFPPEEQPSSFIPVHSYRDVVDVKEDDSCDESNDLALESVDDDELPDDEQLTWGEINSHVLALEDLLDLTIQDTALPTNALCL